MAYLIHFDFDAEGDPPAVLVWDDDEDCDVLEVFEEPTCTADSGWSREEEDWEPGPLARRVVDLLNAHGTSEEV